jgi:hypothetical protein
MTITIMGRLIKEALYGNRTFNSREIDEGFNKTIEALIRRTRQERERNIKNPNQRSHQGIQYYIRGHFLEEGIPIPLDESFNAESLEQAKVIFREKASEYHNIEGYAINVNLFDSLEFPRKVLDSIHIPKRKE